MRKRTVRVLTGVAVIVVALGLSYAIAVAVSAVKLRRAYAALEKAGRPMHAEAIVPPEVPDTENGALLYESAALLLKAEPTGYTPESLPGESNREVADRERCKDVLGYLGSLSNRFVYGRLAPERRRELKELFSRRAVDCALFAIEEGTRRSAFQFHRNYDAGMKIALPELLDMTGLVCIVGVKACLEAEAGATDRAWQLAAMQAKLADVYRGEPIEMSQLVRMNLIEMSCGTIRRLCEIAPPGKEQQEHIDSILRTFDDVTPLVRAMDGERLLSGEWLFAEPRKELYEAVWDLRFGGRQMPGFMVWLETKRLTFRPSFLADHANYLRTMHEGTQNLERPYSPGAVKENDGHSPLTGMLTPAFGRTHTLQCETITFIRITRAYLALLQYRAAHGAFPATLDALNLDALSDPFAQGPLHYRTEGEGFILYSVGPDGKDNGGALRPPRRGSDPRSQRNTEYDIVRRFPSQMRPAAQ